MIVTAWLALTRWMERRVCIACHRFIWPWQPRHRFEHTACFHRTRQAQYDLNHAAYGVEPRAFSCIECGWLPR